MSADNSNTQAGETDINAAAAATPDEQAVGSSETEKDNAVFDSIFSKKKHAADEMTADEVGAQTADASAADDAAKKAPEQPDYQAQLADMTDKLLRSRAEFDNYRKRITREFGDVREQAKQRTIGEFLPVYDTFILAISHMETSSDIESIKQGMQMILTEFERTFESLGVKEVAAVGEPFDARFHEAVAQEASDSVPEGTVIRQWKSGFTVGENLLRPATVVVSSGKAGETAAEAMAAAEDNGDDE
ncbi:MAG: nucleotide exchange factor GrpE [Lentisphaerae bacterium]|jgi:molecular chaperone GrpE|nr:nucleotide exchange factor GrpE [Lentisphaerota bacterium]